MTARARDSESEIYDRHGRRKYLTADERKRFRAFADTLEVREKTFCLMFYFTGLRISEALELTALRIDDGEGVIVIRTLKRRKDGVFRAVPLPRSFLRDLRGMAAASGSSPQDRLWPFSRKTGYRIIKRAMGKAGITGAQACPKGLRHGFGVASVQKNVPLPLISKWMGHSRIQTTAIYLNVMGPDERAFAKRIW